MVAAGLRAEVALLVLDAEEGSQVNHLLRHGYLLSMLGVKQVIVLVNKMDLVNNSQQVYKEVVEEYSTSLNKFGIQPLAYIPVSGRFGDNIAYRSAMSWYQGATVLEALDELHSEPLAVHKPFRIPVQGVHLQHGNQRRVIRGTVEYGTLRVGDEVVFYPSGKRAQVQTIEGFSKQNLMVQAGQTIGVTLDEQIYVSRGELVAKWNETKPKVSNRIQVNLFWLGRKLL